MARTRTVFQGEHGAFSEEAVFVMAGKSTRSIACATFDSLFESVSTGQADYGVLPIENSLIGSVQNNNNNLLNSDLHIVGETQLRIIHCLIGLPGATVRRIRRVYSHPVALDQCRSFFEQHPSIQPVTYFDTAGAVKMVASSGKRGIAAIASPLAAELYNMRLIRKSIEDRKFNYTRFLLVSRKHRSVKGKAKTSIAFSVADVPGALFKALSVFALRDIDLTKIESHPSRKQAWEYHFFVDFVGSTADKRIINALNHLKEIAHFVKVLGCYPMWIDGKR
jgi:prephenate dehydratase